MLLPLTRPGCTLNIQPGLLSSVVARFTDGSSWSTVKLTGDDAGGAESAGILRTDNNVYVEPALDINADRDTIHVVWSDTSSNGIYYSKCSDPANWNQASAWTTILCLFSTFHLLPSAFQLFQ